MRHIPYTSHVIGRHGEPRNRGRIRGPSISSENGSYLILQLLHNWSEQTKKTFANHALILQYIVNHFLKSAYSSAACFPWLSCAVATAILTVGPAIKFPYYQGAFSAWSQSYGSCLFIRWGDFRNVLLLILLSSVAEIGFLAGKSPIFDYTYTIS